MFFRGWQGLLVLLIFLIHVKILVNRMKKQNDKNRHSAFFKMSCFLSNLSRINDFVLYIKPILNCKTKIHNLC